MGAANPEDYGNYYAWGETETKPVYTWSNYKFGPNYYSLTKYCTKPSYGTVDNKTILDPEDDVAHVTWGGNWRMPTIEEQQELLYNCTWTWTTKNNIYGCEVKAPNGNSIFLPAAGYQSASSPASVGEIGYYASCSLNPNFPDESYYLYLTSYNKGWSKDGYRHNGLAVRPVIAQ